MCGFIGFHSNEENISGAYLARSIDTISARGVTTERYVTEHLALGYSRLPTDAVSYSAYNSVYAVNRAVILFNGIVTNVDDLCDQFDLKPECRNLDTVCVREGFRRYGKAFLERMRGMFAFAYMDDEKITLVRDTVGIKPLYAVKEKGIFGFCSEIKGLAQAGFNSRFQEIAPGEILTYDRRDQSISRETYAYKPYKYLDGRQLQAALNEAVLAPTKRYLKQTNRNMGILLSGGLDSSLLTKLVFDGLASEEKERIHVFTMGCEGSEDIENAKLVAAQIGCQVTYLEPLNDRETLKELDRILYNIETSDPRVVKVAVLQEVLARALEERDIQVLISGEGADELFFGYERFIDGLTPAQSERFFGRFMSEIFPHTLLQRYERQFARRCIEGRVPFLDQEVVALANQIPAEEKLTNIGDHWQNKVPLRNVALDQGLVPAVALREKMKMTQGVTRAHNSEDPSQGFLEAQFLQLTGRSFREYCQEHLDHIFPLNRETFPVHTTTEGSLMAEVAAARNMNLEKDNLKMREDAAFTGNAAVA